jgi:hypothetical protein
MHYKFRLSPLSFDLDKLSQLVPQLEPVLVCSNWVCDHLDQLLANNYVSFLTIDICLQLYDHIRAEWS